MLTRIRKEARLVVSTIGRAIVFPTLRILLVVKSSTNICRKIILALEYLIHVLLGQHKTEIKCNQPIKDEFPYI